MLDMSENNEVKKLIEQMAKELSDRLKKQGIENPLMIGIHTGGVWVAKELHRLLGLESELGMLDISFYRDDFTRIGMHPQVRPTNLPFDVEDSHIILVDDVLHTGRTIRAAMNEIFDYGRPASIELVALVDRSGRELPIQAGVTGKRLDLAVGEHVKLSGPEPMVLEIQKEDS
jgi:pyrimidine operon attenuation protein/uracil phosphoribosyltransferase